MEIPIGNNIIIAYGNVHAKVNIWFSLHVCLFSPDVV